MIITRKSIGLETKLTLYNVSVGKDASSLKIPQIEITKSALIAQQHDFLFFIWTHAKRRVSLYKVCLADQTVSSLGYFMNGEDPRNMIIMRNGKEIWAVSSFWPQIQIYSTVTRQHLCRFRVLNESKSRTPLTFTRYQTLWLNDLKAAIFIAFDNVSLIISRMIPSKRSAETLFSGSVTEQVRPTKTLSELIPRINVNYQNSTLILLADGGLSIFIFKFANHEKRLSVNLQAKLYVSPQIINLLGEGKEAVYYHNNQWLLVRHRFHVTLFWVGTESCEASVITTLNLGEQNSVINGIFIDAQNFWILTESSLLKCKFIEWVFDSKAKAKIRKFNFPLTAGRIKCTC